MAEEVVVTITREDRYRFVVDFGKGISPARVDEPPPLGGGAGPSPVQLLAAAIANCLSASFIFANAKFKEDPGAISALAKCKIARNQRNRLRVVGIDVEITLGVSQDKLEHLDRALAEFEEFCTVSQSVRAGIPFHVAVVGPDGRILK